MSPHLGTREADWKWFSSQGAHHRHPCTSVIWSRALWSRGATGWGWAGTVPWEGWHFFSSSGTCRQCNSDHTNYLGNVDVQVSPHSCKLPRTNDLTVWLAPGCKQWKSSHLAGFPSRHPPLPMRYDRPSALLPQIRRIAFLPQKATLVFWSRFLSHAVRYRDLRAYFSIVEL